MFYYEHKNMFGRWSARTCEDRPSSRTASGGKVEIRNVQELPFDWELLPLSELQRRFNPASPDDVMIWADGTTATREDIERGDHRMATEVEAYGNGYYTPEQVEAPKVTDPGAVITALAAQVHADNVAAGWWTDLKTGEDLHGKRNVGEMLCLIHSEISEAMEGHRKRLMDDKLPHRPMLKVELIDAMIRILDLLGSEGNDEHPAGVIFQEKRDYNAKRADHKPEARLAAGGKAF